MTGKQKEHLDRQAEKAGIPMAEYIRALLAKRAPAPQPPSELWEVLENLYALHDTLLRIGTAESAEAAGRLEDIVVRLQAAFTAPRKAVS